jgi:hypothetical protein
MNSLTFAIARFYHRFPLLLDTLAERANEGLLNDRERADYEALINATDFVSLLKLRANRQPLQSQ